MANEVYIVSAVRTPVGTLNGSLSSVAAHDLGAIVIREALRRANVDGADVDEVIVGQVLTAGHGQNPARQASLAAGVPKAVPAWGLNMLCGSGLKTVILGAQSILTADAKVVVAVGQESMSQAKHTIAMRGTGNRFGDTPLVDTILRDGLLDVFHNCHMGVTAENVAQDYSISREQQDAQALDSQQRYAKAKAAGHFDKEIVPVPVTVGKETVEVKDDEHPRSGMTLDKYSKMKAAFVPDGSVTAGNASGINDGAAAVVLVSRDEAERRGLKPLAKVVAWAQAGIEPRVMGMGPVPAVRKALAKAGWSTSDVDLFELNEAFASIGVALVKELGIDPNKVNIQGGAIAIGHPLGSSGTRVLVTLLHSLQRTGGKKGVASLCIGGGMGIAMCVEVP